MQVLMLVKVKFYKFILHSKIFMYNAQLIVWLLVRKAYWPLSSLVFMFPLSVLASGYYFT